MIYLKHPKHGAMWVASKSEADYNAQFGWAIAEPETPALLKPKVEQKAEEKELSIYERYEAKFGKPAHHRMKPETIIKALEEE